MPSTKQDVYPPHASLCWTNGSGKSTIINGVKTVKVQGRDIDFGWAGYKVYLYFVSTESPEINKYRVGLRVSKGGHHVDPNKITQRYYRSLDLLFDAAQLSYQAYFFDNSTDGKEPAKWFAHFKLIKGKKKWDDINPKDVPEWFKTYYSAKVKSKTSKNPRVTP